MIVWNRHSHLGHHVILRGFNVDFIVKYNKISNLWDKKSDIVFVIDNKEYRFTVQEILETIKELETDYTEEGFNHIFVDAPVNFTLSKNGLTLDVEFDDGDDCDSEMDEESGEWHCGYRPSEIIFKFNKLV